MSLKLMVKKLLRRPTLWLVDGLVSIVFLSCFKTSKATVVGAEHLAKSQQQSQATLVAFWHGRFMYCGYGLRLLRCAATTMASQRFVGLMITRVVERFFHLPVLHGSNKHGWASVLKRLGQLFKDPNSVVALTVDGPSGPARLAKSGTIRLANRLGAQIILMSATSNRYFTFNSWDKFRIPWPFSQQYIYVSAPITIPDAVVIAKEEHLWLSEQLNRFQDEIDQRHHGEVEPVAQ